MSKRWLVIGGVLVFTFGYSVGRNQEPPPTPNVTVMVEAPPPAKASVQESRWDRFLDDVHDRYQVAKD